jgi:Meckel syndrome type 1 protein
VGGVGGIGGVGGVGGIGGIGGIRPPVFYPPPIYYPPPFYGGYYGAWGFYADDWMWGMAVGVGVAAVAVAATENETEGESDSTTTTTITTTTVPSDTPAATSGAEAVTPVTELPCTPVTKNQDEVRYSLCGPQHYVLAYGGTGPIYIPVPPPEDSG